MLKINTDKQTAQKAIAKVQEALYNKNNKEKQEPKEKEKTKEKDEVKE